MKPTRDSRNVIFTPLLVALVGLLSSPLGADECTPPEFGTDGFWVSSFNTDEILRFDATGTYLGAFTAPSLNGPRGITVASTGEVYVSSQHSNEILVFDPSGVHLRSFTAPELMSPTGSVLSPEGDLYVCSFGNDRVLRFVGEERVESFNSPGLNGPNCILFRNDGSFWVTGQLSNDVHRFAQDGTPLGSFPATEVVSVMGAAFDRTGRLLVAGGSSDTVGVFACDGQHLDTWSVPGGPQSIAVREDGMVFITTFYSDEVLLYRGPTLVDSWTGGDTLRGIEFFPAPLPTFVRGDADRNGELGLADPLATLLYLFADATSDCDDALDTDDDGQITLSDALGVLTYLFQGGPPPAPPFPGAGIDPRPDALGCLD